jgi:hypothetical protein
VTELVDIEFNLGTTDEVVGHMAALADGGGWITLLPGVLSEDRPPPKAGLFTLLSAGSNYDVPEGSWMPPAKPGKRVQIGVQHNHGPKAIDHLTERGHPLPAGWRKAMDHPKRGLVVEVPASVDHHEVIDWLLSATILLTTVPLLDDWLARIHTSIGVE